ncbi:DUF5667 domain-containing protein [Candidatus Protofrankia californiensis]|uniref:DUF5667 domain-containing protein n=1 Tax=Candidatus Protofrankia californiensis TaxID=1839754 RepID=UPI0010415C96|nr:DUF5667 domain-containing protein [Candidatus Protofrankia californiensis]
MGVLLTGRRAERFDRLINSGSSAARAGDRERQNVVAALRAYEPVSPRPEFRTALRARLLAQGLTAQPPNAEISEISQAQTPGAGAPNAGALPAKDPAPALLIPGLRGILSRTATSRTAVSWNIIGSRPGLLGALATSVVVAGIAVGTHRAVPGEPLYGLKLRVEHIQLDLTSSPVEKAKIHLDIARTRLDEINSIMDDGRLPKKTVDVRNLLTAWQHEASVGGNVLVPEARNGSQDAFRTVQDFTDDQSRDLHVLLDSLPDGPLHTMTAKALDYMHGVHDTLSTSDITPPAAEGAPSQADTSRPPRPVPASDLTPPVTVNASPEAGGSPAAVPSPLQTRTAGVAGNPNNVPATRSSENPHAPTAAATTSAPKAPDTPPPADAGGSVQPTGTGAPA